MKKLLIPFLCYFLCSCADDSSTFAPSQEDILTFANAEELLIYVKNIDANQQFLSYDKIYNNAIDELGKANTVEEHDQILES